MERNAKRETMMNATYLVPACNIDSLLAAIEKLNKRAVRLDVQPIAVSSAVDHIRHEVYQLTVNGEQNRCWRTSIEKVDAAPGAFLANAFTPTGSVMAWHKVEVSGEAPSLNGWSIVSVLEPLTADDGSVLNLIRNIPGEVCPNEYRTRIGECDHCKATRRRKETFVVRHPEGSTKCVGRQCLKDFLGYHADPHALAGLAELLAQLASLCESAQEDGDDEFRSNSRDRGWTLDNFLAVTATRIRLFGWVSRTVARDSYDRKEATADTVIKLVTPPDYRGWTASQIADDKEYREKHVSIEADATTAEAAIEWARNLSDSAIADSDYLANVNLVARVGLVTRKLAGVAASIVSSYLREQDKLTYAAKQAARPESNHVGTIGKRAVFTVTCEKVIRSEGQYGVTGIHKMTDDKGNDLTWFASESTEWLAEGQTYQVKATPKSHGDFQGRKQTVLNRVAVVKAKEPAVA